MTEEGATGTKYRPHTRLVLMSGVHLEDRVKGAAGGWRIECSVRRGSNIDLP